MKNPKHPLVSVLLPLYNEPESIARLAVDSIINQTYRNLEIILLLDNPNNEVLINMMKQYKGMDQRITIHINDINKGLPDTLNIGIGIAKGDYIARMDGDDISALNRIEKQIQFLQEHHEIALIGTNAYIINEKGDIIGEYHKVSTDFSQKIMLKYLVINLIHPTWLGKAEIFRKCKYRNFMYCEDYDFMIRAYALGYNFYNMQEKLLYYRIQQTDLRSLSRKYAYEQYINTLRIKTQFKEFRKKRLNEYPNLPNLNYDMHDKEKFQSTVLLINQLREAFFQKKIIRFIVIFIKISRKDFRPLAFKIKAFFLSRFLFMLEKVGITFFLCKIIKMN